MLDGHLFECTLSYKNMHLEFNNMSTPICILSSGLSKKPSFHTFFFIPVVVYHIKFIAPRQNFFDFPWKIADATVMSTEDSITNLVANFIFLFFLIPSIYHIDCLTCSFDLPVKAIFYYIFSGALKLFDYASVPLFTTFILHFH